MVAVNLLLQRNVKKCNINDKKDYDDEDRFANHGKLFVYLKFDFMTLLFMIIIKCLKTMSNRRTFKIRCYRQINLELNSYSRNNMVH